MAQIDFQEEKQIDFQPIDFQEEAKPLSYQEKRQQENKERRTRLEKTPFGKIGYKTTDYLFPQALTEKEFAPGERTLWGDVFERPGAAIRGMIFPKEGENRLEASKRGWVLPESQPSASESLYLKSGTQPTGNKLLDIVKAYPTAFSGQAIDIATQPANWLLPTFGMKAKIPIKEGFGKAKELVKSSVDEIMASPLAETAKRGFVQAVENVKSIGNKFPKKMDRNWLISQSQKTSSVADDTIKAIQGEIADFRQSVGQVKTNETNIKNVIADLLKGDTKEEAQEMLDTLKNVLGKEAKPNLNTAFKIKDLIQKDIPESVWMRGKKGFNLTPAQAKKVKSYFKLDETIRQSLQNTEELGYYDYLQKKATDVYRLSKTIKRMVIDTTGQPTETGRLVSAFSGKAGQAGKENLFYRLKELNEDTQEIIKNMHKFRQRQTIKKVGTTVMGGYGLYELGKRIFGKK